MIGAGVGARSIEVYNSVHSLIRIAEELLLISGVRHLALLSEQSHRDPHSRFRQWQAIPCCAGSNCRSTSFPSRLRTTTFTRIRRPVTLRFRWTSGLPQTSLSTSMQDSMWASICIYLFVYSFISCTQGCARKVKRGHFMRKERSSLRPERYQKQETNIIQDTTTVENWGLLIAL